MENTIEKIDNFKIGHSIEVDDYDIENLTDEADDLFVGGKKSKIDLADMNRQGWRNDIALDIEKIKLLLILTDGITAEHDTKLQQLKADLKHKIEHPINGNNKKVIVFTAFADTAEYLYNNLATPLLQKFGLHSALVTGTERPKSTLTAAKNDFNTVLTLFSPISKDRQILLPDSTDEIDILFATDCISEGQNLQDCDYLVNYDIHWNPVRIIQRFGRIDRIGSLNKQIQLVNYWPDIELDDYINLKGRVESRMKATILASTGDDNLLSADEKGDLNYRREQLKRLQQEVVDLEEMGTGINIMDLGLNEFRLDLLEYMHDNIEVANAPFGLSAVVAQNEMLKPGVMFVLQNKNKEMSAKSQNLLHPYYLLYIDNEGNTICNHLKPKDTLNLMRAACKGKKTHNKELCKLHNKQTKDGQRMTHYSDLLKKAIESIIGVNSNNEMARLLNGETELFRNNIRGLDDFELICFLVVK